MSGLPAFELQAVRARGGGIFVNVGPFVYLDGKALDEVKPGDSRLFDVGGLLLPCQKNEDGSWKLLARSCVPVRLLSGRRSAARQWRTDHNEAKA